MCIIRSIVHSCNAIIESASLDYGGVVALEFAE